ncbi:MAG: ABC transporter permease [Candidatus Baltobacteraceae bacterium]
MTWTDLTAHVQQYLALAVSALAAGGLAGLILGGLAAHSRLWRAPLLTAGNLARVVPSLAILTFMLPLFGIGFLPSFAALSLLAAAPVLINTDLGFRGVPPAALDAAAGMGMTRMQTLLRVEWPLAVPIVFTGVRTAATEVIASAVLASFIGAGGLGEYITTGLQADDARILWTGVGAIGLIAIAAELLFAFVQHRIGDPA